MAESSSDGIGILKSIWRRNDNGVWIIHGVKGLNLKPRAGFDKNYFKIEDELSLLTQQPGPVMDNLFASFGGTEFLARQSIVPVVAWNEGDQEVRCIGTAFFISASGLLLTAAHVVRDPVDENYTTTTKIDANTHQMNEALHFGILMPVNPAMMTAPFIKLPPELRNARSFVVPFDWTQHWGSDVQSPLLNRKPEFQLSLDIAVCKVSNHPLVGPYQPLNIGQHALKVGDRAVAIGYGEMKNIRLGSAEEPELLVSVGSVTNIYADNITEKQNSTPGPNFEFDARIPGKMSGAPILVGDGILTKGVVSRSWEGENYASGCLIAPVMSLPLHDGRSLLDVQQEGMEGIATISGAGI